MQRNEKKTDDRVRRAKAGRFRIAKLEERIAPTKGGKGTNNCGGTIHCTDTGAGSSY